MLVQQQRRFVCPHRRGALSRGGQELKRSARGSRHDALRNGPASSTTASAIAQRSKALNQSGFRSDATRGSALGGRHSGTKWRELCRNGGPEPPSVERPRSSAALCRMNDGGAYRGYIAVTDRAWFDTLRRAELDEINFWQPSPTGVSARVSARRGSSSFIIQRTSSSGLVSSRTILACRSRSRGKRSVSAMGSLIRRLLARVQPTGEVPMQNPRWMRPAVRSGIS